MKLLQGIGFPDRRLNGPTGSLRTSLIYNSTYAAIQEKEVEIIRSALERAPIEIGFRSLRRD